MPVPINIDAANAIDMTGLLPYTNTQQVDDSGVTYTVWYKYTFATDGVIGILGYGASPYIARMNSYGPNSSVIGSNIGAAFDSPAQLQGHAGEEFFFKFLPTTVNPTPAILNVSFLLLTPNVWPAGSLIIPDDTSGNPGIVISAVDGTVLGGIVDFPAGEQGDSILSPDIFYATEQSSGTPQVEVFDSTFTVFATAVPLGTGGEQILIRANKTLNKIYFLSADVSDNWILQSIESDGTVSGALTTITIGQNDSFVEGFCVANDGNIVYITADDPVGSPLNSVIKQWDIGAGAFLTNFAPSIGDHYAAGDILVLEDDRVVVLYHRTSTESIIVKVYESDGSVHSSTEYGPNNTGTGFIHIGYALDSPDSFWLWIHPDPVGGTSRFINVRVSDSVNLTDFTIPEFETGVWIPDVDYDPGSDDARFGISFSCPFYMVAAFGSPLGSIVVTKTQTGGSEGQEFNFEADGLTPTTFTLEDGQSHTFTDVEPGIYGIEELPAAGYQTLYNVSNGDPIYALEIVADETITVTVSNVAFNPLSGIYQVVPDKRDDTLWESFTPEATEDVKIPDPYFRTALFGK